MLEILTFTGVDSQTDFDLLSFHADRWPRVEFGILVGSVTDEYDHGIFPPIHTVERLREWGLEDGHQTALHLCGAWARGTMQDGGASRAIIDICEGFGRVQVNLHADHFNQDRIAVHRERVAYFADRVRCDKVILQHRGPWGTIPVTHEKVEYLFDRSEGAGIEAFNEWPEPSDALPRMGYAGGIGPKSINEAMEFVERHADKRLWLDMESRVRKRGWLNHFAVEAVCERAFRDEKAQEQRREP